MAVAFDTATPGNRSGTTDPHTFTHTPIGTPRGVILAAVHGTESTDLIVGVTYGGVAMTRIKTATDTATEPGRVYLYFLGSGIPTGAQTVSIDLTSATTTPIDFTVMTLTASADTSIVDSDSLGENQANPSVTLSYAGLTAMSFAVLYGGGAAPSSFVPNGNCINVSNHDMGAFYSYIFRQTTPGTSDFAIGGTSVSDDVAFAALAVTETASVSITPPPATATGGVGTPDGVDVTIGPLAAAATASVVAPQVGHVATVVAPAASATAAGLAPTPSLTLAAAVPQATASVVAPTPGVTVSGVATATAAVAAPSLNGSPTVTVPVAQATASVAAPLPTLTVAPTAATAPADGLVPVIDTGAAGIVIVSPAAEATASVATPDGVDVTIAPEAASADAGVNGTPFVSTSSGGESIITAPAASAWAVAQEQDPFPWLEAMGPPTPMITVSGQATATADALTPAVSHVVAVPTASATASVVAPVREVKVTASAAAATAAVVAPTAGSSGDIVMVSPAATATAAALVPLPLLRVVSGAAAAAAQSPTTTPGVTISAPVARATAAVTPPTPGLVIAASAAAAANSCVAPIFHKTGSVFIVVAVADATASVSAPLIGDPFTLVVMGDDGSLTLTVMPGESLALTAEDDHTLTLAPMEEQTF